MKPKSMGVLGLIPEPPFDPLSWSGSSAHFFRTLQRQGVLASAHEVSLSTLRDAYEKARTVSLPLQRWKERYHASVPRFRALTRSAGEIAAVNSPLAAVLQIGAWFSSGTVADVPCFSYHDGNAALWYRYYGRGLLSGRTRKAHLGWELSVYSAMTGIFVMSEWLADSFTSDFAIPRSKLHVVGAGINIEHLPEVPDRSRTAPRYLLVGRDFERKGGRYLLEAFRKVRKAIPEAELILVGPEVTISEPGLRCTGYLSKSNPAHAADLHQLFSSATTLVLPSVYEPFGISLLEGMAYGLPCIAVDRCAMPEIVRHAETGLIARAEDAGSLAEAMIELGKSFEDGIKMGAAGRLRVESHFTWAAVGAKIRNILADVYGL